MPASGSMSGSNPGRGRGGNTGCARAMAGSMAPAALMEPTPEAGRIGIDTGTLLATSANSAIAHIHHRMPVVIGEKDFARWLDCLRRNRGMWPI